MDNPGSIPSVGCPRLSLTTNQENGDVEGVQAALRLGAPVNATNESLAATVLRAAGVIRSS